ncbi:hypothetical protein ACPYO6_06995 [Georgenia sp. Z1344]|uniref:hypothetical protein n=1 Tax=Georgenia sp. Z1344 TaxID=3416706 RepID=UPI003CECE652
MSPARATATPGRSGTLLLVLASLVIGALVAFGVTGLLVGDEEEPDAATRDAAHACLLARSIPADAGDDLFIGDDGIVPHSRFYSMAALAEAAGIADGRFSALGGYGREAQVTYAEMFSIEPANQYLDSFREECDRLEL